MSFIVNVLTKELAELSEEQATNAYYNPSMVSSAGELCTGGRASEESYEHTGSGSEGRGQKEVTNNFSPTTTPKGIQDKRKKTVNDTREKIIFQLLVFASNLVQHGSDLWPLTEENTVVIKESSKVVKLDKGKKKEDEEWFPTPVAEKKPLTEMVKEEVRTLVKTVGSLTTNESYKIALGAYLCLSCATLWPVNKTKIHPMAEVLSGVSISWNVPTNYKERFSVLWHLS